MNFIPMLLTDLPAGSIIKFDSSLLIEIGIYTLNMLVLFGVLTFILYKPVKKFMLDRKKRIEDQIETAKTELANANLLKEEYEDKLKNIEREREEVLRIAHKKAVERGDKILQTAREKAEDLNLKAILELKESREVQEEEIKKSLVDMSFALASRFINVSMDNESQNKYLDDMITAWEEESVWQEF